MRILAIDDDPIYLEILTGILVSAGYDRVKRCSSANAALTLVSQQKEPFDCVLLDIEMPEKDGISLCRELRSRAAYKDTPILMLTASKSVEDIDKSFAAGATDFVSKPIDGLELGSRVRVAKILNEQNCRLAKERHWRADLEAELSTKATLNFDGELTITGVDGCSDFRQLQIDLLNLDPKPYAMKIFLKLLMQSKYLRNPGLSNLQRQ